MDGMELVTGKGGSDHIGSEDVGEFNACLCGTGCYVFSGLELSTVSSNIVRVGKGEVLLEGRYVRIKTNIDVTLETGVPGQNRRDFLVFHYTRTEDGVEDVTIEPRKGIPSEAVPSDPSYASGSIRNGDTNVDIPFGRVTLTETALGEPESMLPKMPSIKDATYNTQLAGVIYPFAGGSVPSGFLLCDGRAVSRTVYKELYQAIGITYGAGDNSTTFNIPDLRGRAPIGSGQGNASGAVARAIGAKGGEETHKLTVAEMAGHAHTMNHSHAVSLHTCDKEASGFGLTQSGSYGNRVIVGGSPNTNTAAFSGNTGSTGSNGVHNNMQPYIAINYIIATGQGGSNAVDVNQVVRDIGKSPLSLANIAEDAIKAIILRAHPVGSYYWSDNATSPAVLFGGTWTQIKGRFLYAKEDSQGVNATGGAKTVALSVNQMPKHSHEALGYKGAKLITGSAQMNWIAGLEPYAVWTGWNVGTDGRAYFTWTTAGNNEAHENMPPWIAAYCWKRTA